LQIRWHCLDRWRSENLFTSGPMQQATPGNVGVSAEAGHGRDGRPPQHEQLDERCRDHDGAERDGRRARGEGNYHESGTNDFKYPRHVAKPLADPDAPKQLDHVVAANQFRATNEKEYAGERELRAFKRDQLTSPPPSVRRFELIAVAAKLSARKALAKRV
jgi:hypothetical protein